jgi:hypothetical protein
VNSPHQCCGSGLCGQDSGPATCGPSGWTCPGDVVPEFACRSGCNKSLDGNFEEDAETDATTIGDDNADDETGATDGGGSDAGLDVCATYPFDVDTEAGADAGPHTLTREDAACITAADCTVQACGFCSCTSYAFGVNVASAFECPVLYCPPPGIGECSPRVESQDCAITTTLAGVGVECVNHECRTIATWTDASAPNDATDGKE